MSRRIIAEVGSCFGDVDYALDCVDAFAEVGVWAIKGQLYDRDRLTTLDAPTYGRVDIAEPATQWEAFEKSLTYDEWGKVAARARARGIEFFGSVFDLEGVKAANDQGWDYIKLASADITYRALYKEVADKFRGTVIWSTGASSLGEIRRAAAWLGDTPNVAMACTLCYPTEPEDAHVFRMLSIGYELGERPGHTNQPVPVGYSDHTRGTAAGALAFRLGAWAVEKHVTLKPGAGGDHDFAATPEGISRLRFFAGRWSGDHEGLLGGDPALYPRECEREARLNARRSLYAAATLEPGDRLSPGNVVALRPATGLAPDFDIEAEGFVAKHTIRKGAPIRVDDLR